MLAVVPNIVCEGDVVQCARLVPRVSKPCAWRAAARTASKRAFGTAATHRWSRSPAIADLRATHECASRVATVLVKEVLLAGALRLPLSAQPARVSLRGRCAVGHGRQDSLCLARRAVNGEDSPWMPQPGGSASG